MCGNIFIKSLFKQNMKCCQTRSLLNCFTNIYIWKHIFDILLNITISFVFTALQVKPTTNFVICAQGSMNKSFKLIQLYDGLSTSTQSFKLSMFHFYIFLHSLTTLRKYWVCEYIFILSKCISSYKIIYFEIYHQALSFTQECYTFALAASWLCHSVVLFSICFVIFSIF